ncbi:hypothetical protein EMCRGX_G018601 [Ephydatia muelleri]|eukprot:Em0012g924a
MEVRLGNSTTCNISVAMAKDTVAVFVAFSTIATLCYLGSVLLIVKTQAYRQFVHRLTLYIGLSGLFRAIAFLFQVIPVDIDQPDTNPVSVRKGWEGACTFGGMIVQYAGFVQSMGIFWICLYVFVVVVLRSQRLRQRNLEVIGVVLMVLVPVLFTWEPFVTPSQSYGISGTRCWIKDTTCNENSTTAYIYTITIVVVPHILLTFSGFLLMMLALFTLANRVRKKIHQRQHWLAIKDILPLAPYPLLYSSVWFVRMLGLAAMNNSSVLGEITVALIQASSLVLPLSLIVRSSVRDKLACRCCWSAMNKRDGEKEQLQATAASDYSSHDTLGLA